MSTVGELLAEGAAALASAGVDRARSEARLLLQHASGIATAQLVGNPGKVVVESGAERYRHWIERRARREPFAYIVGRAEFWSLTFSLGPGVLIPRPDSETLVEAVIRRHPDQACRLRVLDIGIGSGCLLLSLLHHFPNATGIGTDTSTAALAYARTNAEALGVADRARLVSTPWAYGIEERFDVLVSNPPYIPSGDIAELQPEVCRFEPLAALDGGLDGLDGYRAILPDCERLLAPDGAAFLEVGAGQAREVLEMAGDGLSQHRLHRDLGGIARCLELFRREA